MNEAITEIRVFAQQMRQMTELVCQVQSDMAQKITAANQRMAIATDAIAAGEARIVARIAEFETMSAAIQTTATAQQNALAATAEKLRDNAAMLSQDLLGPLKNETADIVRDLVDSGIRIRTETSGLMSKVEDAAQMFHARAEAAIKLHTERSAETVGNALLNGQAKLAQTADALNAAADSLARGILSATESHDTRAAEMITLTARITKLTEALPDAKALADRDTAIADAAHRVETAAQAVSGISTDLATAAAQARELLTAPANSADAVGPDAIERIVAEQIETKSTISSLIAMLENGFARVASGREDMTVEVLSRLDSLSETVLAKLAQTSTPPAHIADAERESMLRLTVALRLVMRDIGRENGRLGELVEGLCGAVADLQEKLAAAPTPSAAASVVIEHDVNALPPLDAEKTSLMRLMTGFRLLLQDIGGEADRFRSVIDAIATQQMTVVTPPAPESPTVREDSERILSALAALAERLDSLETTLQRPEAATPNAIHAAEKESLQRMLVGFRILLGDIGTETEKYRVRIAAMPQPEPTDLAPVAAAAERIGAGVAETLAAIELKLEEPLARLTDVGAESANLLKVAHAAMVAPLRLTRPVETAELPSSEAMAEAVARMERAAELIDGRTAGLAQLTAQLKRGGVGEPALRALTDDLLAASEALRREAGDFLAIGAALSRDIERTAGPAPAMSALGELPPNMSKKRRRA